MLEEINQEIKVSVCMITYNHAKYIDKAIEGVLVQNTNFKVELLISDDASPDETESIVKRFLEKPNDHVQIKYFKHSNNIGPIPNFQWTLEQCRGLYIAICDGDDYWTDELKIQKQFDFLENNPDYSLVFTRFNTLIQLDNFLGEDKNGHYFNQNDVIEFDLQKFEKGWHIGTQTVLFRKERFDLKIVSNYKYFRDIHLYFHLLKTGRGACLNRFSAVYRIHFGGIHNSKSELQKSKIAYLCYKELYFNNKEYSLLKKKYLNFAFYYINNLVINNQFNNSLFIFLELFWNSFSFKYLVAYFKVLIFRK